MTARDFLVPLGGQVSVTARAYAAAPSDDDPAVLFLAHGAGAGHDSAFIRSAAQGLASRGISVVTFNFPYIERRSKVPNPLPQLEACFRGVIEKARLEDHLERHALFLGGKSLGGRVATHVAANATLVSHPIAGLVLLGYPLHPPGKPTQPRTVHLPSIAAPMFIVQGTRDAFGTPEELDSVLAGIPARSTIHRIEGGDHSFKVARQSAAAQAAVIDGVLDAVAAWIRTVVAR
jgi:predicted alpha/beta-hydrolase family hydrolase